MKEKYDLSKLRSRKNLDASRLKKPVTMLWSEDVARYFKGIVRIFELGSLLLAPQARAKPSERARPRLVATEIGVVAAFLSKELFMT